MISSVRRQCGKFPKVLSHVVERKFNRKTRTYLTLSLPVFPNQKAETVEIQNDDYVYMRICSFLRLKKKKKKNYNNNAYTRIYT